MNWLKARKSMESSLDVECHFVPSSTIAIVELIWSREIESSIFFSICTYTIKFKMYKSHKICPMLIKKITFLIWERTNIINCLLLLKSIEIGLHNVMQEQQTTTTWIFGIE